MTKTENSPNSLWENSRVCEEREGYDLVEIKLQFNYAGLSSHPRNTAASCDANVPEYPYSDDTLDRDVWIVSRQFQKIPLKAHVAWLPGTTWWLRGFLTGHTCNVSALSIRCYRHHRWNQVFDLSFLSWWTGKRANPASRALSCFLCAQASILDVAWERSIAYIQQCCDGILCKHERWPSPFDPRRWIRNRSWSRYIGLDRLQSWLAFLASFLAAYGGKKEMSSDTPHPGKGLRPLHSF